MSTATVPGARSPENTGGSPAVIAAAWIITRLFLVCALAGIVYPTHGNLLGDVHLYRRWVDGPLSHGLFPHDAMWQYPPGAALVLALPRLVHVPYDFGLVTLFVVADLVITIVLARRRDPAGAWFWVAGMTALGPVALVRFDVVSALLAVLAVLVAARPLVSGPLLAAGGLIKVWPLAGLSVLPRRTAATATMVGAAVVVATIGAVALFGPEGWAHFLTGQRDRGLQIESVPATPFMVARLAGWGPHPHFAYGAQQIAATGANTVAVLAKIATILVLVASLARHMRSHDDSRIARDFLLVILLVLVVSPVLSAQYLVWPLALAGLALGRARVDLPSFACGSLIVAAALTQAVYPALYNGVVGGAVVPTLALAVRNAALVAAAMSIVTARRPDRRMTST